MHYGHVILMERQTTNYNITALERLFLSNAQALEVMAINHKIMLQISVYIEVYIAIRSIARCASHVLGAIS